MSVAYPFTAAAEDAGVFWMTFEDFVSHFASIFVNRFFLILFVDLILLRLDIWYVLLNYVILVVC